MQLQHSTLPLINLEASLGMLLAYRRKAKTISRVENTSQVAFTATLDV